MRTPALPNTAALLLGCLVFAAPLQALVKFNDGHDDLFVTGTAGVTFDSNLYSRANSVSDTLYTETIDVEYQRRAGMLGINGKAGWNFGQFARNTSENYADPHVRAELNKGTGRTTGSLALAAQRENRTEYELNLRTRSWDYSALLNLKYPVIDRYSIAGQAGYDYRDYQAGQGLFDIRTSTAGSDLYYSYSSQRDILGGYRLRITDTTNGTRSTDHAFTLGTTGKLLSKLTGTVRAGYQFRQTDRNNDGQDATYSAFTATASAVWSVNKRISVSGTASRDFTTIATDVNVDSTTGMVTAAFATTAHVTFFVSGGGGELRYLGARSEGRHDTYATGSTGVTYTQSERFKVTLTTGLFRNWSKLDFADYTRRSLSVVVSSRW